MASNPSTYLKNQLLNWFKDVDWPASPTTVYVSLHTADPGGTGANEFTSGSSAAYARVAVTTATGWSALSDNSGGRLIDNAANITFPTPTGNGQTATHWGIWDASSAGNFLWGGSLTQSFTWTTGDQKYFPVGDLDLVAGATTV